MPSARCFASVLDSDIARIPAAFQDDPAPQLAFNRGIIDATAKYAAAYKFNMAFYEANGADGWRQFGSLSRIPAAATAGNPGNLRRQTRRHRQHQRRLCSVHL